MPLPLRSITKRGSGIINLVQSYNFSDTGIKGFKHHYIYWNICSIFNSWNSTQVIIHEHYQFNTSYFAWILLIYQYLNILLSKMRITWRNEYLKHSTDGAQRIIFDIDTSAFPRCRQRSAIITITQLASYSTIFSPRNFLIPFFLLNLWFNRLSHQYFLLSYFYGLTLPGIYILIKSSRLWFHKPSIITQGQQFFSLASFIPTSRLQSYT